MNYYGVWVRSQRYHGTKPLTYACDQTLAIGTVVRVQLQQTELPGIVVSKTNRPPIKSVKSIKAVYPLQPLPNKLLELTKWLMSYYPTSVGTTTQLLLPKLPKQLSAQIDRTKLWHEPKLPQLTKEQSSALLSLQRPGSSLLHGITGSGKTRMYQELTLQSLRKGRSVLILSPEIGLTSQLVTEFEIFGKESVVALHSKLSPAKRVEAWRKINSASQPIVVIGARSALFSPLTNIGLIVVDEAHDSSYKQEQPPHYQTSRVAAMLARLHNAVLVYGTATPLVSEYHLALQKGRPIVRLNSLAIGSNHSNKTTVVDLKDRSNFTLSPHLSNSLIASIRKSVSDGEQSLLYLNRRGTARLALCQKCGWQAICPNCDLPMTYHADKHLLMCHVCNYKSPVPTSCPICHQSDLLYKSAGTKAIESEVRRLFPEVKIMRFDSDNTIDERLEQHLVAIRRGSIDILVGTQTLAKGLDLPKLSTLGVIMADTSLYISDYTANEQTYQLMNQVIGRVGRGHRSTRAIVQAYAPDHPAIRLGLSDAWEEFYSQEIAEREMYKYPPFYYILKLTCKRKSPVAAKRACDTLKSHINNSDGSILIDGPAPALHERTGDSYYWQLVVKSASRGNLVKILEDLPSIQYGFDIDPSTLL